LLKSTDRGLSWSDVSGPIGPDVVALALSPSYPVDGVVFAANASGGLFKSGSGGSSWSALPPGVSSVTAIAVSPTYASDGTVAAGTAGEGVVVSTDGGATWNVLNTGLSSLSVTALAFSPAFGGDQTIFAGTAAGVFLVREAGASWAAASQGITDLDVTALALSATYATDRTVFAASRLGGVFKSTDAGGSWAHIFEQGREFSDQSETHYFSVAVSPNYSTDQSVFVATFEGFWKTQDGGSAWRYMQTLPPSLTRSLSASPSFASDATIFASTYGGGMIRSGDAGQSWESRNTGLVNCYPDATDISPGYSADRQVFAGGVRGLQRLVDGEPAWRYSPVRGVAVFARSVALSPDYSADRTIFIGTDNYGTDNTTFTFYEGVPVSTNGVFSSADGGSSWAPTRLNGVGIHSLAISPAFSTDGTMFAASGYIGLFKSTDRGLTWARVPGAPGTCCTLRVVISPNYASDATLFVAVTGGGTVQPGLYASTDGGNSWSWVPESGSVTILDLALSPSYASDRTLFVGTLERGVMVSKDGGATLVPTTFTEPFVTALEISPAYATDGTVFAAAYEGLGRSRDSGNTWTIVPGFTRYEDDRASIVRNGNWTVLGVPGSSCGAVAASAIPGDTVQFPFVGTQIAWIGIMGPAQGIANVYLDGVLQATVDLYAPAPGLAQQVLYRSAVLPSKGHVLTIAVTNQRNPSATDSVVTVDAFDVSR
jgi:photosystem II stability/assembly factor-like uncharacterized protein